MKRIISSTLLLFAFAFSTIAPITKEATENYTKQEEKVSKSTNDIFPTVEININGNDEFESDLDFKIDGADQHIHYTAGFYQSEMGGEELFRMEFEETRWLFNEYYWSVAPIDTPDWELLYESQRSNTWYNNFEFWSSYDTFYFDTNNNFKISIANIYEKDFSIILLTKDWKSLGQSDLIIPVRFNVHINGDLDKTVYNDKEEYSAYMNKDSLLLKQKNINKEKTLNESFINSNNTYETEMNYFLESNFEVDNTKVHYSKRLDSIYNPGNSGDTILRNRLTGVYDLYDLKEDFEHSILESENYRNDSNQLLPSSLWRNFWISSPVDFNHASTAIRKWSEKMTEAFLNDPVNDWIYSAWYYDENLTNKVPDTPENRRAINIVFNIFPSVFILDTPNEGIIEYANGEFGNEENKDASFIKIRNDLESYNYELIGVQSGGRNWYMGMPDSNDLFTSRKWIVDYIISSVSFISDIENEFLQNMHIRIVEGYDSRTVNEDIFNTHYENTHTYSIKSVRRLEINDKSSILSIPEIITLTTFVISIIIVISLSLLFISKNIKENDETIVVNKEEDIKGGDE